MLVATLVPDVLSVACASDVPTLTVDSDVPSTVADDVAWAEPLDEVTGPRQAFNETPASMDSDKEAYRMMLTLSISESKPPAHAQPAPLVRE